MKKLLSLIGVSTLLTTITTAILPSNSRIEQEYNNSLGLNAQDKENNDSSPESKVTDVTQNIWIAAKTDGVRKGWGTGSAHIDGHSSKLEIDLSQFGGAVPVTTLLQTNSHLNRWRILL